MKKQRILSSLLALVMTFSLLPGVALAADVKDFTDVSKDDWYYTYVDHVVDKGYFAGTSETTFSPNMSMDRAMFAVVLAAVEGVKVDNNVSPFADVPAGTWYSGAVAWAAEKGIVAGGDNNNYYPTTPISREQMAVIMNAYINWYSNEKGADHKVNTKVKSFGDADKISSWAAAAVETCRNYGLVAGAPDGNFYPLNSATRAEVSTVIYNLAWIRYGGGGSGPSDPQYTDYIYEAVKDALDDVKETLGIEGTDATVGGSKSFVTVTGIEVNKPEADDEAREQLVTVTVNADSATVEGIAQTAIETATSIAMAIAGDEETVDSVLADLNTTIDEIVNEFKDTYNVELNAESIRAKIDEVYGKGLNYGKGLWAEYFIENDKYITGNVTISCGDAEVEVIVDAENNQTSLGDVSQVAAIKTMAVAIAKDLYSDLLNVDEYVALTEIDLDAKIDVLFSEGEYASDTNNYSYEYPLTIVLNLDGTAADQIEYMYDGENHKVQLVVTDNVKEFYLAAAEQIVAEATMLAMDKASDSAVDSVKGTLAVDALRPWLADPSVSFDSVGLQGSLNAVLTAPEYAEYAEIFNSLDARLQTYVKAVLCDKILGETKFVDAEMTAAAEAAAAEMEISELKELAGKAGVDTVQYDNYIEKIEKLTDLSQVKMMKLHNLATALRTETVQNMDIALIDSIVDMVDLLPAKAYITVDGVEISEAVLVAIREANGDESYDAIADMIDLLGDLCLNDFMTDGVEIYVNYNDNYDFTVIAHVVER